MSTGIAHILRQKSPYAHPSEADLLAQFEQHKRSGKLKTFGLGGDVDGGRDEGVGGSDDSGRDTSSNDSRGSDGNSDNGGGYGDSPAGGIGDSSVGDTGMGSDPGANTSDALGSDDSDVGGPGPSAAPAGLSDIAAGAPGFGDFGADMDHMSGPAPSGLGSIGLGTSDVSFGDLDAELPDDGLPDTTLPETMSVNFGLNPIAGAYNLARPDVVTGTLMGLTENRAALARGDMRSAQMPAEVAQNRALSQYDSAHMRGLGLDPDSFEDQIMAPGQFAGMHDKKALDAAHAFADANPELTAELMGVTKGLLTGERAPVTNGELEFRGQGAYGGVRGDYTDYGGNRAFGASQQAADAYAALQDSYNHSIEGLPGGVQVAGDGVVPEIGAPVDPSMPTPVGNVNITAGEPGHPVGTPIGTQVASNASTAPAGRAASPDTIGYHTTDEIIGPQMPGMEPGKNTYPDSGVIAQPSTWAHENIAKTAGSAAARGALGIATGGLGTVADMVSGLFGGPTISSAFANSTPGLNIGLGSALQGKSDGYSTAPQSGQGKPTDAPTSTVPMDATKPLGGFLGAPTTQLASHYARTYNGPSDDPSRYGYGPGRQYFTTTYAQGGAVRGRRAAPAPAGGALSGLTRGMC